MNDNQIITQLANILEAINLISGNSKKIDELPVQEDFALNGKIHVSINGVSKSMTISQLVDEAIKSQNNKAAENNQSKKRNINTISLIG